MTKASKRPTPRRVEFPYLKDATGHHAPIVYLQAWTGNRWLYLQAYVDSGASWSIFHADVAQLLGLKPSRGRRLAMAMGNGHTISVMMHRVRVRFAGGEFTVPGGFSEALTVGFNLLGRAGFFDRFIMCFNDRTKLLSVSPHSRLASH